MNHIKALFSSVMGLFTTPAGKTKISKALADVYDVLQIALPIVSTITTLTPTKSDDEVLAVIKRYLPNTATTGTLTDAQKAVALRDAAVSGVSAQITKSGVSTSTINAAVELAVTLVKATA